MGFWQATEQWLASEQLIVAENTAGCPPSLIKLGTGRAFGYAQHLHSHSVEHPHRSACVLDAHRTVAHDFVQVVSREIACNRLVIADSTNPAFALIIALRLSEFVRQFIGIGNVLRADRHRPQRLGKRKQMDVMVVKPRQQSAPFGINYFVYRLVVGCQSPVERSLSILARRQDGSVPRGRHPSHPPVR